MQVNLGMLLSKLFPVDYSGPDDAILENQMCLVFSLLRARGIRDEVMVIGFVYETKTRSTQQGERSETGARDCCGYDSKLRHPKSPICRIS